QARDDLLVLLSPGPLRIDVEAFGAAAEAAHRSGDAKAYEEVIELYTGDLLPEDLYEDWTIGRREELHSAYLALLVGLARLHEGEGDLGPAIETLQKAVASDPANEEAHASLMRLYAAAGQRHKALRQYAQLREALKRELDTEPEETTRRLYEEIQTG